MLASRSPRRVGKGARSQIYPRGQNRARAVPTRRRYGARFCPPYFCTESLCSRITLAHFCASTLMKSANSSGELDPHPDPPLFKGREFTEIAARYWTLSCEGHVERALRVLRRLGLERIERFERLARRHLVG